ncbi:cell division protein ZipA [Aurantivibrio infirmus]
MREWLTAIIVLLIVAVILDGLRRMRQHRRSSLRMSLSMHQGTNKEDLDDYGSELPSGGARVVDVREENDAKQLNRQIRQSSKDKLSRLGRPYKIPEQVTLNLDEQVPMLMESIQETKPEKKSPSTSNTNARPSKNKNPQIDLIDDVGEDGRIEPQFQEIDIDESDYDEETSEQPAKDDGLAAYSTSLENQYEEPDEIEDVLFAEKVSGKEYLVEENSNLNTHTDEKAKTKLEPEAVQEALMEEPRRGSQKQFAAEAREQHSQQQNYQHESNPEVYDEIEEEIEDELDEELEELEEEYREPDLVLVINVTAPKGSYFPGPDLLDTVVAQGMRFGVMNVFHHHAEANGEGSILYSMANIVMPGTFDLNEMDSFVTPGISLFLALPVEGDSGKAFETMLGTARAIAQNLGGDLKDENRSVLTQQTIEHYRSRIKEYERKRLSRGRN